MLLTPEQLFRLILLYGDLTIYAIAKNNEQEAYKYAVIAGHYANLIVERIIEVVEE